MSAHSLHNDFLFRTSSLSVYGHFRLPEVKFCQQCCINCVIKCSSLKEDRAALNSNHNNGIRSSPRRPNVGISILSCAAYHSESIGHRITSAWPALLSPRASLGTSRPGATVSAASDLESKFHHPQSPSRLGLSSKGQQLFFSTDAQ